MAWLDGTIIKRIVWTDTHVSLRIACERPDFIAGQFVRVALDIDGEQVARPYSCVNSSDSPYIEIFFNWVPEGPLSPRLMQLQEGDHIWVADRCSGFLTLQEVPDITRDLWMIATGTGIGPFLSIMQTTVAWERFDRLVLAHGVRHTDQLAYADRLAELSQQHRQLTVIPCVTRDAPKHAYAGRVTQALADGQLEARAACQITPEHSHFMLCGNTQMIRDMGDALKKRGLKKHLRREPGHISSEKYH